MHKRIILIIVAVILIILGVVGLLLPLAPGLVFLVFGLILLSLVSRRLRTFIECHTRRFPKFHDLFERYQGKIARWIGDV